LLKARRPLEEELDVERQANARYEAYRARGQMKDGRRFGRPPNPFSPPDTPQGKVNITDPDSKLVHGMRGCIQGYNAQAVCNEQHVILAAEAMTASPDFGHLARWSTPPGASSPPPARPTRRGWSSPTPATGTSNR